MDNEVVYEDISRECNDGDTKAREDVSEHHAFLKDRMMAPGISFRPRISKEWEVGHCVTIEKYGRFVGLSVDGHLLRFNRFRSPFPAYLICLLDILPCPLLSTSIPSTPYNFAMSTDSAIFSDDDRPLATKFTPNGTNHVNGPKTNGHVQEEEDYEMSEGDDEPLATRKPGKRKKPLIADSSSSDDDIPLASSPAKPTKSKKQNGNATSSQARVANKKPPKKKVKQESDAAVSSSDDEKPLVAKKAPRKGGKVKEESLVDGASGDSKPVAKKAPVKGRAKTVKEEPSDSETQKPRKRGKAKKEEDSEGSPVKGKGKKKKDEEEKEIFKWWEQDPNGDGSVKWTTLEHYGVIFPPPYEPLPSHVKMKYNGKSVDLPPEAEEVAGFYGAMLETPHAQDAVFNKNFFDDWKKVMNDHPPRDGTKIANFELCDFRPMFEYFESEKAKKKAMSSEEKKTAKKAKDELEAKYIHCFLDGRKEKVGNYRVEPPGLFRGRGEHPKKGALKQRVKPEDIILNIGKDAPIPVPNVPGKWKAIQHDNTVTWLANWTENINGNHKYVFLAAGSSLKGQSDMQKFEKARELKNHVDRIRLNYQADLKSKVMADRQRATAMYFIDKLALRAGNEKGEDEADTVGCCSLRCEHVTLEAPDSIIFDFLGKDSIRYYNTVQVEPQVFKNIRIFKENKNDDDSLFDRVNTSSLNKHLNNEMKGLTAKVFRTFNASITFQRLLDEQDLANATVQEKLNAYNKANREVAILCNHQRTAPKTHDQSMERMRNKYRALKYERMKLRHALFAIDSKAKKNKKYSEEESDLEDDWIVSHEEQLKEKEIEKAEKKFARDNEKLIEEGKKPHDKSVLKERLDVVKEDFKRLAKERGTKKATLKRDKSVEKIEEMIDKLTERIKTFKLQMIDRDETKEIALGTSKINYLDPRVDRITAAWCQIHSVPIEKIFSKTLVTKYTTPYDLVMSRQTDPRSLFTSHTAFSALDIESGEDTDEEVEEEPEENTPTPTKPSKSALKKAARQARLEKKQQQRAEARKRRAEELERSSTPPSVPPQKESISNGTLAAHPPPSLAVPATSTAAQPEIEPKVEAEPQTEIPVVPAVAPVPAPPVSEPEVPAPQTNSITEPQKPLPKPEPLVQSTPQVEAPKPLISKSPEQLAAEAEKEKKRQNIFQRTIWTIIMIGGFIGLLLLGHVYMILLVMLCQTLVYREVTALFSLATTESEPQAHGRGIVKARDPWSKTLNWYFFAVTNYFLYGESIIYYFKVHAQLLPFVTNHRMISFTLYIIGFMGFVMSLKRGSLKQQFGLFCWVHMTLLMIVVSSHFIVNNILEGLIWFWVPASLVICNDVFAYVWGITLGRTPLIKLSPKKTVEGFVGAFFSTVIFALFWGGFFMRFNYMICPVHDLGVSAWSSIQCKPNPVFVWREMPLWRPLALFLTIVFNRPIPSISYTPYHLHLLLMACFSSLVAPFGGFFASGFKRAFNIKDFGHSIPGHGGMTDRMDCHSLIREHHVTVGSILQTIVSGLTVQEQLELVADLRRYLGKQGIVLP
ncbi:hypothetical protein D9756_005325 [Leucocoprinus leucothites]|uniref:Multifunctional fusion protein n=1 Tax=Leucocoprinus leucothites TaxID=201217 RepID=A0A8H5D7Z4_9AGAR|nr:hypothetical protein D9756_005325 [Leucoagaricus leucothites]